MNFDTLGEPNPGPLSSSSRKKRLSRTKRGGEGKPIAQDELRWELMLLLSIHETQERYVALLRSNDSVDLQYLASEEAFLADLGGRVQQMQAALAGFEA